MGEDAAGTPRPHPYDIQDTSVPWQQQQEQQHHVQQGCDVSGGLDMDDGQHPHPHADAPMTATFSQASAEVAYIYEQLEDLINMTDDRFEAEVAEIVQVRQHGRVLDHARSYLGERQDVLQGRALLSYSELMIVVNSVQSALACQLPPPPSPADDNDNDPAGGGACWVSGDGTADSYDVSSAPHARPLTTISWKAATMARYGLPYYFVSAAALRAAVNQLIFAVRSRRTSGVRVCVSVSVCECECMCV
eukprot:GHVU01132089.1.p1 GENE.GHVU01132089.1~~GHVU01132089.1.p1  ORF type:complete len:248 (+),score=43.82 GHVU01132089.1:137-880(+)